MDSCDGVSFICSSTRGHGRNWAHGTATHGARVRRCNHETGLKGTKRGWEGALKLAVCTGTNTSVPSIRRYVGSDLPALCAQRSTINYHAGARFHKMTKLLTLAAPVREEHLAIPDGIDVCRPRPSTSSKPGNSHIEGLYSRRTVGTGCRIKEVVSAPASCPELPTPRSGCGLGQGPCERPRIVVHRRAHGPAPPRSSLSATNHRGQLHGAAPRACSSRGPVRALAEPGSAANEVPRTANVIVASATSRICPISRVYTESSRAVQLTNPASAWRGYSPR